MLNWRATFCAQGHAGCTMRQAPGAHDLIPKAGPGRGGASLSNCCRLALKGRIQLWGQEQTLHSALQPAVQNHPYLLFFPPYSCPRSFLHLQSYHPVQSAILSHLDECPSTPHHYLHRSHILEIDTRSCHIHAWNEEKLLSVSLHLLSHTVIFVLAPVTVRNYPCACSCPPAPWTVKVSKVWSRGPCTFKNTGHAVSI